MHPSSRMGIGRKLGLLLCCLIPIYGQTPGSNETKLLKPPIHEEYDDPSYSLSILRPIEKSLHLSAKHSREYVKEHKGSHKHYNLPSRSLMRRKKQHLTRYQESYKYSDYEPEPTSFLSDDYNTFKYFRTNQNIEKPIKERHKHQHRSVKNDSSTDHSHRRSSWQTNNTSSWKLRGYSSNERSSSSHQSQKDIRHSSRKYRRHDHTTRAHNHHQHLRETVTKSRPYFGVGTPSSIVSQIDSHAFLPCVIHDLEDQTVSWIRNRDAHILTVDRYTFISDNRFVSWFESETSTWTLQIKFVNDKDAGSYECQLSAEKKMSHFVNLTVIVPKVTIPEGRELYVRKGSDISLKCVITNAIQPPQYVFWYFGNDEFNRKIAHQAAVTTLPDKKSVASLVLQNAAKRHAGNYTCAPLGISRSASVMLHVLNGEHPAAMQHGGDTVCKVGRTLLAISTTFTLLANGYLSRISS